jgi:cyclic beta-1,2-glucan synthetase
MRVSTSTIFEILSRLRVYFQGENAVRNYENEDPFRSELFSSDQLNNHGKVVAGTHKLLKRNSPDRLLKRLVANEAVLLEVRNLLVESIDSGSPITPAAEWLLDNYYLIEEQIAIARKHLPKGYSEGLPYLAEGHSAGMPRVYDLVLEMISHSDGRVDVKSLTAFIAAYQEHTVLTIGEIWAIPIMLRLAVIENLRRIAGKIALDLIDNDLAGYWATRMITTVKEEPGNLILTIADMVRSKPVLDSAFVAGFTRELQGKGPALALPLSWMEQQLTATGSSSIELVRKENQKQAIDQISVRNSIGTLRVIGATDWRDFVEALSSVEHVLRQDPHGTYPMMDFATRDRYRHVVESIAKASDLSETQIAGLAMRLAVKAGDTDSGPTHIGYNLIGKGVKQTEKEAGMRYTLWEQITRVAARAPVFLYSAAICILMLIIGAILFFLVYQAGAHGTLLISIAALLCLSGSAQLSIALVNWISTILVKPRLLPRMDFSRAIPPEYRTLIAIPTLLAGAEYIEELVEGLEIRYLANREPNLHYALLTDFPDADAEVLPDDAALLELTRSRIRALNEKYDYPGEGLFFLFHRPRTWNAREKKWMGYERKRGKLGALNAFLRGRDDKQFSAIVGDTSVLAQVKYIITLDSDTQLPREAAWKFVATMAHPMNRASYDAKKGRVTEGYGILQPRVASAIPKTAASLYLRMQGDLAGIDPYTRVSSDVYQDLFGEGSFIGKGIYDIDIFEQAVGQTFPENRILSHDLLEGCYARSGLLSDVLLYEENPSNYLDDVRRHHRWIRGDWQIGAWMLPFVTGNNGRLTKNRLSGLSRWKIFDNLRRSVFPQSLLLLFFLGWYLSPLSWLGTLAVSVLLLLPLVTAAGWQLINKPEDLTIQAHLTEIGITVRDILVRFLFDVAVLPFQALVYTDAIVRTNWRMIITRKKLLEWRPSASAGRKGAETIVSLYLRMWIAPLLAIGCTGSIIYLDSMAIFGAESILLLWLLAPAIVWRVGIPEVMENPKLSDEQVRFLQKAARKTWSFFEQFLTAEDNWLPPDNFQEQPIAVVAHRTSPTNMGLSLLAGLAAYDFGYIAGSELLQRTRNTLTTMGQLDRYRGHFYNWYDTQSLVTLPPRYVSTVDSGNLIGHLLTLRQGILTLPDQPIFNRNNYEGLEATVRIIEELAGGVPGVDRAGGTGAGKTGGASAGKLTAADKLLEALKICVSEAPALSQVKKRLGELALVADIWTINLADSDPETVVWVKRLVQQIERLRRELGELAPWGDLLPVPGRFDRLAVLEEIPSLTVIKEISGQLLTEVDGYEQGENGSASCSPEEREWLSRMRAAIVAGGMSAVERIVEAQRIIEQCEQFSMVDYDFLYDKSTSLFRIGYNMEEQRKDESSYDLLATEARLGVFVAIAQGQLPQESWFALGRLLTSSTAGPILLSWSGSMFEYLMPQLVMPAYENTLLSQTNKSTVKRQIEYGDQRDIPWGISESSYNMVDAALNYQYRAFGVPGLGLKRGLKEDLVIAPYATMLALMIMPLKACENLQILAAQGFVGKYGFFEAVDYTPSRVQRGKTNSIVYSFMAHHQGMSLLSLAHLLLNKPMQRRFEAEPLFQATLLLLQERVPRATLSYAHTEDPLEIKTTGGQAPLRRITTPNTPIPEIQLLSNGRYHVMVTNSGGGYSRWNDIAVTRWREDTTRDDRGIFCYIKDVNNGNFWSNTWQPALQPAKGYEAVFSPGHVEFRRQDFGIDTKTEIVISPEDDTEMRRVRITNKSHSLKVLEITSYAEMVMASQGSDEAHQAFSNLFVQTEIRPEQRAVFCTRRPRSATERPPWLFHLMEVQGAAVEMVSYETDRLQFIGRGRTLVHPQAMDDASLSGKQGAVLDPVLAIRCRVTLKINQTVTVDLIYGINETKEGCEGLVHKYRDQHLKNRAFDLSWTHNQVLLRQINATESDAQLYDALAASVIYANPALRAEPGVILSNMRGQSGLWSHSVSGDLPIVLLHIYDQESIELVRQMVQAHKYWRLKGLAADLVIWNETYGSYRQALQEQILGLMTQEGGNALANSRSGSIFVRSADQISSEDRVLFESIARVIISDNKGSLSEQVNGRYTEKALPPALKLKPMTAPANQEPANLPEGLLLNNSMGGFTTDGKEYKIITDYKTTTPAPWVNVISNPSFGSVISESGSAYTWAVNAHEYRITSWSNDSVCDIGGEALYLRDEETGQFWSPSSFPAKGATPYLITHGFGYSVFAHTEQGISSECTVFVDKALPVKFIVLKITNRSGRERKFSATGFLEIVLGDVRSRTNMHIISEQDSESGAMLIRNRYNTPFTDRVTFFKADGPMLSFTGDRSEFIGRNANLAAPQAMLRRNLSDRSGAGMDPCAAVQVKFDLLDGGEKDIIFQMGNDENLAAVQALIRQFSTKEAVLQSLQDVREYWQDALGAVQISTPDAALNLLANGWLTYQTMASRIFARSAFYQSGGAWGFRDQLQDVLALLHNRPALVREQIMLSASHQFAEGDVQHWWHPPEGRGVRTLCSDDLLWLPYVTCRYIVATGDTGILLAVTGWLESRPLQPGEDSLYDLPVSGNLSGTLYEHCVRAIRHSLRYGKHGLPLIGSGDWNDGMDKVGDKGQGESVWLAFFQYDVLTRWAKVAEDHGDTAFAGLCRKEAVTLQSSIETKAWDGDWYLRAYFDDGTPLGSKVNTECRIDAIAQSWSVLSGAADKTRSIKAMASLDKYLVKRDLRLIQLLDPPFNGDGLHPGYIEGYVPGVRENGGQYSHAAIWALIAFAALGDREKVWELFSMIQPLSHAADAAAIQVYKVEPYVMAADVYANESHKGRGGWTWYTGSSGWMYQFITGWLLGMELQVDKLIFKPCWPLDWPSVTISYRYRGSLYRITIFQVKDGAGSRWEMDGNSGKGPAIVLSDDGKEHEAKVYVQVGVVGVSAAEGNGAPASGAAVTAMVKLERGS